MAATTISDCGNGAGTVDFFLDDSNGTAFIDGGADFDDCSPLENCEVSNLTACPFTP